MSNCTDTITWSSRLSSGPLEGFTTWLFRGAIRAARFGDRITVDALTGLLVWRERWRQRQTLGTLSDHMLRDVGLGRTDVEAECRKPFWIA